MRMVFAGEKPRRELAACWRVEVVKGGKGARDTSDSFTSSTDQFSAFAFSMIDVASFSSLGSLEQVSASGLLSGHIAWAVMTQKSSGINALIARSFSKRM